MAKEEINLGQLVASEIENYPFEEDRIKKLNESEDYIQKLNNEPADVLPKKRNGNLFFWRCIPGNVTNLDVLVDLSFGYINGLTYEVNELRMFIRPKPRWSQIYLKAKQKATPDAIDFKQTMKDSKSFVFALSQNYKRGNNLFEHPMVEEDKKNMQYAVLVKEGDVNKESNKHLTLLISCSGYHLYNGGLPKIFSRDKLISFVNLLIYGYTHEFNKLKKSDFEFKK